ncbi:IclR family transcriptional regulator [Altericroceibacterium endophyticum]|uniref:Helix-turn-helix domain-containing protein n=1 Tax=Altericroceibacterium endophyticum TaxID=1808508 RepID=A0A6I4T303_9SPHN|nr:IclR family transcriptional regulator [Altericroceibacterium endophyticum]MXO65246.1 helix-turn-helix domain-containing protein [Altericroceibacterium endophyticum]
MANEGAQSPSASSQVKSATRTLDIIEYVVAHDRPLVAQEIANALAIPVSSLSYLLGTLVDRRYLIRDGRRYSAGPGLEKLKARTGDFTLSERVAPLVRTLRVQLDETCSFFIRTEWEVEPIVTESSDHALRYSVSTGTRLPLHALSSGKALLAECSEDELQTYFARVTRKRFTPSTHADEEELREEIARIRSSGFAFTDSEYTLGIRSIGRVVKMNGAPIGALSVAIPQVRYDNDVERRAMDLLARIGALLNTD